MSPRFEPFDDYTYGEVVRLHPLVRRVLADNSSKFTYRGTGTYIVGCGEVVVIDPGPDIASHRDALLSAVAGETVIGILVTHCHTDHSPLATWLQQQTGAPTFGGGQHPRLTAADIADLDEPDYDHEDHGPHAESFDYDFTPSHQVSDGETVVSGPGYTLSAVLTPGHTSNHVCWALEEERMLFSGDHIMGWSTTVVAPPDGDMAAYMASLDKVVARGDDSIWPTHGVPRTDVADYVTALLAHRRERERRIVVALASGAATCGQIVDRVYDGLRPERHRPARRTVWAHLRKLVDEGRVVADGRPALAAVYRRSSG